MLRHLKLASSWVERIAGRRRLLRGEVVRAPACHPAAMNEQRRAEDERAMFDGREHGGENLHQLAAE